MSPQAFIESLPSAVRVRFLARVKFTDTCWLWTGTLSSYGYGVIGVNYKTLKAHRVAYTAAVGEIPPGLHVDHLCRVRTCVNPEHLEPVTPRENILRGEGAAAKRARQSTCHLGHPLRFSGSQRVCDDCGRAKSLRYYHSHKEKSNV
jgi:hypothetical protein